MRNAARVAEAGSKKSGAWMKIREKARGETTVGLTTTVHTKFLAAVRVRSAQCAPGTFCVCVGKEWKEERSDRGRVVVGVGKRPCVGMQGSLQVVAGVSRKARCRDIV